MNLDTLFVELRGQFFPIDLPVPHLAWNSRMRSCAGRFSPGASRFNPMVKPTIEIASYLRELPDGAKHIRDTLLHEMIHYVLWWQRKPYGHTPEFYALMKRTGATRFNPVPRLRPYKHWYQCMSCQEQVPARRELGTVACAKCCKRFNGGYFSKQFVLVKISPVVAKPAAVAEQEPLYIEAEDLIARLQGLKELVRQSIIG